MEKQKKPRIDLWQDEFHQRVIQNKKKDTRKENRTWNQRHSHDSFKEDYSEYDNADN